MKSVGWKGGGRMETKIKWYECSGGADSDVVVSTRLQLSRNISGIPFCGRMRASERQKTLQAVLAAMEDENSVLAHAFFFIPLWEASKEELVSYVERRMAAPEFVSRVEGKAIFATEDESSSVFVNGGEHLLMQTVLPGLALEQCYETLDLLESNLAKALSFSFDEQLGYLTQNPADLGTGLHAALMLHLPGLDYNGAVPRVAAGLSNLGMDLRSGYEMENQASLYQLTSRVTLGISEQETLYNLKSMAQQVLIQERSARQALAASLKFQDTVERSLAILRAAKLLSCKECMELLSNVRLGVACGLLQGVGYETILSVMLRAQPATLALRSGRELDEEQSEALRAAFARRSLAEHFSKGDEAQ